MSLSPGTIEKLKALAERGIGGEKENARRILIKNGINPDQPLKKTFTEKVKTSVFGEKYSRHHLGAKNTSDASDMLLILTILHEYFPQYLNKIEIYKTGEIYCTPSQFKRIQALYTVYREKFQKDMFDLSRIWIKASK